MQTAPIGDGHSESQDAQRSSQRWHSPCNLQPRLASCVPVWHASGPRPWRTATLTIGGTTAPAEALTRAPFPDSDRVIYAQNPLAEVICQIRFPTVLRIDSDVPANFQEHIRKDFPLFTEEDQQILPTTSPELAQLVRASLQQQIPRKIWKFRSENEQWEATLTREAFSLSTTAYRHWEEFRDKFAALFSALQAEYAPSFITRIGLRYQNVIARSTLGLATAPWSDLLKPHISAEYSSNDLSPFIQEAVHRVLINLPEQGKVNLRHGTALKADADNEVVYLIDNDFFTEAKTGVAGVIDRLNLFNRESGRLFRWCISEELHQAMGPTSLPSP